MIKTKEDLRFYLQEDAKQNGMSVGPIKFFIYLLYGLEKAYAYRYLKQLRYCEYYSNRNGINRLFFYFFKIRLSRMGLRYNVHIPLNKCGYGLRLIHISGGGHILNVSKVGNYCSFNAGTILGNSGSVDSTPIIGDRVTFAPGAKAFGSVSIGDDVIVLANAVVTKNVSSNSIVGGCPAKFIKLNN